MRENVIEQVWEALKLGAKNRRHPFHLLSLAYMGEQVECCSIVLRECDNERIRFHTHIEAPKIQAIKQSSLVCLMGYDSDNKMQVRMKGTVTIYHQDDHTKAIWEKMPSGSKQCYQLAAPGGEYREVSAKELAKKLTEDPNAGYENMAVCWVEITDIDVLYLHHEGHKRYRAIKSNDNWDTSQIQA